MNEQIKELYKQSANQDYFPRDNEEVYMSAKGLEKFAELIVRECVSVGHKAFLNDNSKVPVFPVDKIKQHFGVEE